MNRQVKFMGNLIFVFSVSSALHFLSWFDTLNINRKRAREGESD